MRGHQSSRDQPGPGLVSGAEHRAMQRALELAARGPQHDVNPQVGCVIIAPDGTRCGEGYHRGSGTEHAEIAAINDAHSRGKCTRGMTAVVTLEPCRHQGKTGPCTRALQQAGIARVVYALPDPGERSGRGSRNLRAAGIEVVGRVMEDQARQLIEHWYTRACGGQVHTAACHAHSTVRQVHTTARDCADAARSPRPANHGADGVHLVLKTATSLDGNVAAADGSSRWITGAAARAHAHTVRARTGALIVGTGTVIADNPALTARPKGMDLVHQPLRVVVGMRPVPREAAVRGHNGRFLQVPTDTPRDVIRVLEERGIEHAVLEGGPRLATAFWQAGLIDEIHAYLAPVYLGVGRPVLGDLGITTLEDAHRWHIRETQVLGEDLLLILTRMSTTDRLRKEPHVHRNR